MNNVETKKKFDLRSESGFTLMELIVVIGVLAILMTILIPQLTGYTDKAKAVAARADGRTALTAAAAYTLGTETAGKPYEKDDAKKEIEGSLGITADNTKGLTVNADPKTAITVIKKDGDLTFTNTIDAIAGTQKLTCDDKGDRCEKLESAGSVDKTTKAPGTK
ncbi:MAG: prepilin-type N-terminal cleavage/methylation domain-containing protein [Erysipelotrichaceae bacterium]